MIRIETQWERLSDFGMSKRPVMVFTLKILFGPEILFSICNTNRTVPGLHILGVFSWPSQTPLSCLPLLSLPMLVLLTWNLKKIGKEALRMLKPTNTKVHTSDNKYQQSSYIITALTSIFTYAILHGCRIGSMQWDYRGIFLQRKEIGPEEIMMCVQKKEKKKQYS